MWNYDSSYNELYHYGVKGQKWGVRRYQNQDGSLTAAGQKRYSSKEDVQNAKAAYKSANKEFRKDYNKAYRYSERHAISQFVGKKAKTESDSRWEKAFNSADKRNEAKTVYKDAKKSYKEGQKNSKDKTGGPLKGNPEGDAKKLAKALAVGRAVNIGSRIAVNSLRKLEDQGYSNLKAGNIKVGIKSAESALNVIGTAAVIGNYATVASYGRNYWKR